VRVHGITDEMVADAPEPRAIARPLREAVGARLLIFHNASFDLPFLMDLMRRTGQAPIWNPVVDTLGLARGLFGTGGNSLGALAERLGVPTRATHRALDDARVTAELFVRLAERWEREREIRTLAELAAASQDVLRPVRRS
jgi:DNA polymerase III epsilon subunit family exonuclease